MDKYDKSSEYYSKIYNRIKESIPQFLKYINLENLFESVWVNEIATLDPNVIKLTYKCISVSDPINIIEDTISDLRIKLELYESSIIIEKNKVRLDTEKIKIIEKKLLDL
jgi:hypothetical protein